MVDRGRSRRHEPPLAPAGAIRLVPLALAALAVSLAPSPSAAQSSLYFGAGSGLYASDEYCIDPESAFSSFRLGFSGSDFGVSASYEDEDWPWPEPPEDELFSVVPPFPPFAAQTTGEQPRAFRHGSAFQVVAEAFPLGLLALDDNRFSDFVRPFVGAGVHVSRDGEASPDGGPGGVPVYAIQGRRDLIATAGANLVLRPEAFPIGLQVQYRQTALFGSDFEFASPQGEIVVGEGSQTLTWGEVTVGVNIPFGG